RQEFRRAGRCVYREGDEILPDGDPAETTDTNGYDQLAKDLKQLGRIPEAIEVVKQWMKVEPQVDPLTSPYGREKPGALEEMLGMLYMQNHQYPEAEEMLKRSLAVK